MLPLHVVFIVVNFVCITAVNKKLEPTVGNFTYPVISYILCYPLRYNFS